MYWYNGREIAKETIELDITEPGLLYGATVFTTLRTERLSPVVVELHYERLRSSIIDLGWYQPNWSQIQQGVSALTPKFPILRITIFPDGRELITGRDLPPQLAKWQAEGVTVMIADGQYTRSLAQHKTGNYLAPWLVLQQARRQDIQEAIFTDDRGNWLETTTGNLWGYLDGCWYTPPLSAGILPGIARSQILNYLQSQQIPVAEIEWESALVRELEAIAYSNSVIHLIPIHTVLTPMGKLEYVPEHPAMKSLVTSQL